MDELYNCRTQYSTIYLDSCRYLNVHHRLIMVLYYVLISLFCLKPGEGRKELFLHVLLPLIIRYICNIFHKIM